MIPIIRAVVNEIIYITIGDISQAMAAGYDKIQVFYDISELGDFANQDGNDIALVAGRTGYLHRPVNKSSINWYKAVLYNSSISAMGTKSLARQYNTQEGYILAFDVRQEIASGSGQVSIGQEYDHVLWEMCLEVSRMVDDFKMLEHGAYLASGSETRYFNGSGGVRQRIDPAIFISAVEVEETDGSFRTWTIDMDFYLWPYQNIADGSGDYPVIRLDVVQKSGTTKSVWTAGRHRVKVTGIWGVSSTVPKEISRACKIQAARWWKRAQSGWQDVEGSTEFGQLIYVRSMDAEVRGILQRAIPRMVRL